MTTVTTSREHQTSRSEDQVSAWVAKLRAASEVVLRHTAKHTGVGIVCAVAYFDPGNWGVDLQAGSQFGYKLLFVVLVAGLIAVFWQVLASRLGCVTGVDLATNCRLLLYSRPKNTRLWRWGVLYPLYLLAEVAIISTDLAELLGSAIALCMLFPALPLWGGVLLTASDVLILLAIGDPLRGRPVKLFEWTIGALVIAVLICMSIIISKVSPDWSDTFNGFVPSKTIFQKGGLYTSVGIIGATVMPHSLFLGSALATQDRVSKPSANLNISSFRSTVRTPRDLLYSLWNIIKSGFRVRRMEEKLTEAKCHAEHDNRPHDVVQAHLYHGMVDVVFSLLGFAVIINSFILILASAVFYYGEGKDSDGDPASLFDAHDLIRDLVGSGAATLFAVALLFAGQSSTIIATVAGQVVCEGFIRWRVSPVLRRVFTRLLGLIPSMTVAIIVGRAGIDSLLVVSQVVLSIVLPFITLPLLLLTSSKDVMTVVRAVNEDGLPEATAEQLADVVPQDEKNVETTLQEQVSFANGRIVQAVGWVLWLLVVVANVYVLVQLGLGE